MIGQKKRLGDLLVESGLITEEVLQQTLKEKRSNQKLGDAFIEKGLLTVLIPFENNQKIFESIEDVEIIPVKKLSEVFQYVFLDDSSEESIPASAALNSPPSSV